MLLLGDQQVNVEATGVSIKEEGGETIVLLVICRVQMADGVGRSVNPVTSSLPSWPPSQEIDIDNLWVYWDCPLLTKKMSSEKW